MGAGKSTFINRFVDNDEGFLTYDLDREVEISLGIESGTLGDWIRKHTIESFREKEIEVLKGLLYQRTMKVVALGGGIVETPEFWELKDLFKLVFFDVPFEVCYERIANDQNRPLAQLSELELRGVFERRRPFYLQGDLILDSAQIKEIEGLNSLVHTL